MPNCLHMLLSAKFLIIILYILLLILARFRLRANVIFCDGKAHRINLIQMHLLQLGILLILLKLLISISLIDFGSIHWELYHVLSLAIKRCIIRLSPMALRPKLLHTHKRSKTADGPD